MSSASHRLHNASSNNTSSERLGQQEPRESKSVLSKCGRDILKSIEGLVIVDCSSEEHGTSGREERSQVSMLSKTWSPGTQSNGCNLMIDVIKPLFILPC